MKIKIVGFKVGQSRPTANLSINITLSQEVGERLSWQSIADHACLGVKLLKVLDRSDFISIRRVDEN